MSDQCADVWKCVVISLVELMVKLGEDMNPYI